MSDVVVLRALGLGDTLAAVPALRALRRGVGQDRIVLAGPAAPGELLRDAGVVDEVWPTVGLEHGLDAPVRRAVNLHGRGPQSHRLLRAAGADDLVAFGCAEQDVAGPVWDDHEPERARWCRLITSRWDVPAEPDDVLLTTGRRQAVGHREVLIHPGAASRARRWPLDRWATVARALRTDYDVAITGSADERGAGLELAARVGLSAGLRVLAGTTSVAQLAERVASAALVLSGDTGVAHLAYAYGTPSVTIFGPTPPRWWGPPSSGPHVALWRGSAPGDPHGDTPDPALLQVTPDDVVAAVATVLE